MKLLICLCLVAMAAAAPASRLNYDDDDDVEVLRYENVNSGYGNYQYGYELSDGTRQDQRGVLRNEDGKDASLEVQGSFSWIAPNGIRYTITYTADAEHGYRPEIEEGPGAIPGNLLASALG